VTPPCAEPVAAFPRIAPPILNSTPASRQEIVPESAPRSSVMAARQLVETAPETVTIHFPGMPEGAAPSSAHARTTREMCRMPPLIQPSSLLPRRKTMNVVDRA
jgi:hypothetical protein